MIALGDGLFLLPWPQSMKTGEIVPACHLVAGIFTGLFHLNATCTDYSVRRGIQEVTDMNEILLFFSAGLGVASLLLAATYICVNYVCTGK